MRILIVRHAEPDYIHDSLTKKGRKEAKLLAKRLKKEKIDYIYSSPLGRAKATMEYTAKTLKMQDKVQVRDFFREFNPIPEEEVVRDETGEDKSIPWDRLPEVWTKDERLYHKDCWFEYEEFAKHNLKDAYQKVADGLDGVLASHGYVREGNFYRADKSNEETIAIFCHFGVEMVLLSHLMNCSPMVLWHHFVALPSSVTTLTTEERREGKAIFRCSAFGSTEHLYVANEKPSFAARFCETFQSKDRHD